MIALLVLAQMLRIAVPLALAAAGGTISERSGIVNIALEGLLILGAFGYTLGAWLAGRALGDGGAFVHLAIALAGLAGAVLAGVLLSAVHALVCVRFKADQVVSGVAVNLLAAGLSKFLLKLIFGSSSNSATVLGLPSLPGLVRIPVLGSALGAPLVWLTIALVAAAHVFLFHTVAGLRTRATGEHPGAAEAAGIDVAAIRWRAVLACGALAALGGAWLVADQHQFVDGMIAGRGYIALAAVISGRWKPLPGAAACLLFAFAEGLQGILQGSVPVPTELLQVLPHTLALVVLAGAAGRTVPPAALGRE